jgi:hypothetical protein
VCVCVCVCACVRACARSYAHACDRVSESVSGSSYASDTRINSQMLLRWIVCCGYLYSDDGKGKITTCSLRN